MNSISLRAMRAICALSVLVGIAGAFPAQAAYKYTSIDFPGALYTQCWGINKTGQVVGDAYVSLNDPPIGFIYDSKKKTFTTLPNVPSAAQTGFLGINSSGFLVGGAVDAADESGFTFNNGAFTFFSRPDYAYTEGRAISTSGLVSGYSLDSSGTNSTGFIYDPASNTFTDFLPSPLTIAQGINGSGQVVGSTEAATGDACAACPAGLYGFLRDKSGVIHYFQVNGQPTRARGLTDSGVIAGTVVSGGTTSGFVVTLKGTAAFQALTVPAGSLLSVPGSVGTIAEGINGSGSVVGYWTDADGYEHGFIATPK